MAYTLIDTGCLTYGIVSSKFVKKNNLKRTKIARRLITSVNGATSWMEHAIRMQIDIDGHEEEMWAYELDGDKEYDLILGKPWMSRHHVTLAPAKKSIFIHSSHTRVRSKEGRKPSQATKPVSAAAYSSWLARSKKDRGIQVYSASMSDIQKALQRKKKADPREKLPPYLHTEYKTFTQEEADKLPPLRGTKVDHAIEVEEVNGKSAEIPWGPLYTMSREELLVLRKELTSYLDRGFIRVSRSSAAAPVLFAKKPNGGLRFCVDYRALNAITKKDRYPLPLIQETLSQISKAKWFTKVDVIQAFHKIRIAEGDEWKTAFRTRFGLYEWLVTPFGLANAPSTFQRYINWTLREYLDEFCSAYMDDVLIYSDGSREDHERKVKQIVQRLGAAGLHLDVDKSEFSVKRTKYLGFIIEAGEGVSMDPEKVAAIQAWEPPQSIKGIRSFVGFANFYRQFIQNFSEVVSPLTKLTGKNSVFKWETEQQSAFTELKALFMTEPTLVNFDSERETILECDASGWATGGVLSQFDEKGLLRPVGYFSAKNSKAEVNYSIHDKELLAVIKCLEEWRAELRQVSKFVVITDHKNLRYFCKSRLLSERHVRWSGILSQFNLTFQYRPGKVNGRADALSRKEEDVPPGEGDDRTWSRKFQLLRPVTQEDNDPSQEAGASFCATSRLPPTPAQPPELLPVLQAWADAQGTDNVYQRAKTAISNEERKFPPDLNLKISLAECSIDEIGRLLYRKRKWVPNNDSLRSKIIAEVHNSPVTGHPGREATYHILAREFFWPGMSPDIRRFVQNCDVCGRTKPWREMKRGLLRPLPLPDRIWKEISMDFITDLPPSDGARNLMVVTDRLSKDVILIPLPDLETSTVVKAFIRYVVSYHWVPEAIVSDRGAQFLSAFWEAMCGELGIRRRLSTAFHPQTDGSTERMNAVVEAYLRAFINWKQDDWAPLCPVAQIAIKGRNAVSTGVSPFFLQHGYDVDPIQEDPKWIEKQTVETRSQPAEAAKEMVLKLKEVFSYVQARMAEAQQDQEKYANRHRQEAPKLRVGDKVWLQYGRHLSNRRPSKKLDWKNGKYTVTEIISPHSVRLNIPGGIHPVFHVDRLKLHNDNPLTGQMSDDQQPEGVVEIVDGKEETQFRVEKIVGERWKRVGRGKRKEYLVKWVGYAQTTWEPAEELEENKALDSWLDFSSQSRDKEGELTEDFRRGEPKEPLR